MLCRFQQGEITQPLDFVYLRYRYASHYNKAKAIRLGKSGNRNVSRTQSLFEDDLKQYQKSHKVIEHVHEIIVQENHVTGACYTVPKHAEAVFKHGKMERGEGLPVLDKRIKTWSPMRMKFINSYW